MKTPFDSDSTLVHGKVDIADSLTPPPEYGVYGIRWPFLEDENKLRRVRLLLWTCMDCRVLRPLYDQAQRFGYEPGEILVLSMAGGPLQSMPARIEPIQNVFAQLENYLPDLQKVWMVAHTRTCGGLKHFCRGRDAVDALRPKYLAQAQARGVDPELYATQLTLPGLSRILPDSWRACADSAVAEPLEETQSVKLYSQWFSADDAKPLAEVFDCVA